MKLDLQFKSDMDVELVDYMGDDMSIVTAARVSTGNDQPWGYDRDVLSDKDKGLINFLMRDRHGTPFEHNALTFRISAPLFVFYEFHRHRVGWSYNEESGRYRELDPVFYVPGPGRYLRQVGRPGAYTFEPGDERQLAVTRTEFEDVCTKAWDSYVYMLDHGIAKEVARGVLPTAVYKTMYATCNLRSLFSFLSLRWAHPLSTVPTFPQKEIEMVAEELDRLARIMFPVAFEAFDKNGRVAP